MSARATPSLTTLERTFDRMPRFLRAIAAYAAIAELLARRGLTQEAIREGWDLFYRATGIDRMPPISGAAGPAAEAIVELDAWDEGGLRLVGSALKRSFPDQYDFVLNGLESTSGVQAVIGVRRLLERLDALEGSPDREATRAQDHAALAKVAARGIDAAERARLWQLVRTAQATAPAPAYDPAAAEAARREALIELHAWYEEWAEVARVVITKQSHLIHLGLANRARPQKADSED